MEEFDSDVLYRELVEAFETVELEVNEVTSQTDAVDFAESVDTFLVAFRSLDDWLKSGKPVPQAWLH